MQANFGVRANYQLVSCFGRVSDLHVGELSLAPAFTYLLT